MNGRATGGGGASAHGVEPPEPGSIRPFSFPEVNAGRLVNGMEIRVARLTRIPMVSATLVLNAGESWLGEDRAGHAAATGDALEGGTAHRTGAELAELLEGLGADLSVSTGWDATTISVSCHADRLQEVFPILAELVREPSFPEAEVARVRNQQAAQIEQRKVVPSSLAADQALKAVYADGVPYRRPLVGSEGSVASFDPEAARRFVDDAYGPGDAALVVAGDVALDQVEELARRYLGDWEGEDRGWPDFLAEPRIRERRVVIVDRPGSVQSELRLGHVGLDRGAEDYFAAMVFNTLLGGSFTSRLNQRLREERGFTYGVRSRFAPRRKAGPFAVTTAVETAVTADAVGEIVSVLETALTEGPTDEEVSSARDYIAGVFPLRFETSGQVSGRLAEVLVYDLPEDYHATYRDRIRAVTTEAAAAAARRRIRPSEMAVVVAGDASEIAGPLGDLELGPVEVVEP